MRAFVAFTVALIFVLVAATSASEICGPGYFITNSGTCKKCPRGTYQPRPDQNACKPCHDGDIAEEEGSTECTPCGTNSEPDEFRTACLCVEGTFFDNETGECVLCPPGTFSSSSQCYECNEGQFQPEAGQSTCLQCPEGSFSMRGATECTTCPDGEVLIKDKCGKCPAGKTYDTYSFECVACPSNTFKATAGQGACLPCPSSGFSRQGATKCSSCPDGQAPIKRHKKRVCGSCPPGNYYDEYALKCRKCSRNQFQPYENIQTSCFTCAGDSFSDQGSAECTKCGHNKGLMKDGTCGACEPGYSYDRYRLKCLRCRFNQFSAGGIQSFCESCPSRSFALPRSSACFECPEGEALIRKTRKCGTCPAGSYYSSYDGSCEECYDGSFRSEPNVADNCVSCGSGTSNEDHTACTSE